MAYAADWPAVTVALVGDGLIVKLDVVCSWILATKASVLLVKDLIGEPQALLSPTTKMFPLASTAMSELLS
jgi:hypothetical protein